MEKGWFDDIYALAKRQVEAKHSGFSRRDPDAVAAPCLPAEPARPFREVSRESVELEADRKIK